MIQVTDEQRKEVAKIVLNAMHEMERWMLGKTAAEKCACANAIASLASSLDTRPNFIFGDINSMEEDVKQEEHHVRCADCIHCEHGKIHWCSWWGKQVEAHDSCTKWGKDGGENNAN